MKKMICLLVTLLLCCSLVLPVFAAEGEDFVPSISYKEGPGIKNAILKVGGETKAVDPCVIVSTLKQAAEKSTDISQADRDLLQSVYDALKNGSMTLPLDDDYVVLELFDVSFEYVDCREDAEHGRKDLQLKEEGNTLTITFKLNTKTSKDIIVMAYIEGANPAARTVGNNGQWVPVKATNNGDGTLTCEFEDICPVVFCYEKDVVVNPPKTGDAFGEQLALWVAVMVASAAAIVVLAVKRRKASR